MGTIRYVISTKQNSQGESQILIDVISDRTTHYRLKSGIYIEPVQFNRLVKSDRVLSLDYLSKFDELMSKALPCSKEEAEKILQQAKGADYDILTLFDEHTSLRRIEKGHSQGTEELYNTTRGVLAGFLGGKVISIRSVDKVLLNQLISYMCRIGLANSTQQTYFRVIKTFLSYCVQNGYIDQSILLFKPSFKEVKNDVVYLTRNELYRIYQLEIENDIERVVRDVFCIQCFTGMRYSDTVNLKKENIKEDIFGKYISILTKKTTQRLKIYLNSTACEILERYDWTPPHYHMITMNKYLPGIAQKAGVDGNVEFIRFVGSKRVVEHFHKYECIKTHTARRTFICLAIENGISPSVIQSITGHRQLSSFERYIGIGDKSKANVANILDI